MPVSSTLPIIGRPNVGKVVCVNWRGPPRPRDRRRIFVGVERPRRSDRKRAGFETDGALILNSSDIRGMGVEDPTI